MTHKTIVEEDLPPGDLLLCYSSVLRNKHDELKKGYAHVALRASEARVFDASARGVRETSVNELLEKYDHIAVLRAPDTWSADRVSSLDAFLLSQVGKPFNAAGMHRLPKRKEELAADAMEKVRGYFEGTEAPADSERTHYFCSELVTSAFIHSGIIGESASVIFSPSVISPEDVSDDKLFGFFIGYIFTDPSYSVPDDEHFRTSI